MDNGGDEKINNYGEIQKDRYRARRYSGELDCYDESTRRAKPSATQKRATPTQSVRGRAKLYEGPIPEVWTPEHIGHRLVDAFVTMERLPRAERPKMPTTGWPVTPSDPDGQRERSVQDRLEDLELLAKLPTREQVTHMESALEWLRSLRARDAGMALQLTWWSICMARGWSIHRLCVSRKWALSTFWKKIDAGKRQIASDLSILGLPVW